MERYESTQHRQECKPQRINQHGDIFTRLEKQNKI